MIRLALLGGTTAWHGFAFAGLMQRVDAAAFRRHGWPVYKTRFARRARITHAWGADAAGTRKLAAAAGIEHVVGRPGDVIGQVDAVILADDCRLSHHRPARMLLEAGLPTFVDKPLAPTWREARAIVRCAKRTGTPMMSGSALRFANEIRDRAAIRRQIGELTTATAVGVNDLLSYGIHPMELLVTVMGSRVASVRHVGRAGEAIVRVVFEDGRMGIVEVYERGLAYTLEIAMHGTKGHVRLPITDHQGFYENLMDAFLTMAETRVPPIPYDETLGIVRSLLLARRSCRDGREHAVVV